METLGKPEYINDDRFLTNPARVAHRKEVEDILNNAFKAKTVSEWCEELKHSGLPFGPVNNLERAFAHPQVEPRKMIETLPSKASKSGSVKVAGVPVKYSDTPAAIKSAPPSIGEHTIAVLEELGYSDQEIRRLQQDGTVQ
jgi:succinate--hydroxymethylglutarate CoA-transferase